MNKFYTMLGFAAKAGQLITGSAAVEAAVKRRQIRLVICAEDLSPKTLKNYKMWCDANQIPFRCYGTRNQLGAAIGQPERGVLGTNSKQFATVLIRCLSNGGDLL